MTKFRLLDSLLENDSINIENEQLDWKQAIEVTFLPLIRSGAVKTSYPKAVIESTVKNGPYFIVDEHVAMPHARPEDGVFKNSFSLLVLKNPVSFPPDERKINILIGLGAVNADVHVAEGLPQVVALLESKSAQNSIAKAKTKQEIIEIIKNTDTSKYL